MEMTGSSTENEEKSEYRAAQFFGVPHDIFMQKQLKMKIT
jgi:hypothetical protein